MTDDAPTLQDELALALALADTADAITRPPFDAGEFSVARKADRTEVTEIDRAAEAAIARAARRRAAGPSTAR